MSGKDPINLAKNILGVKAYYLKDIRDLSREDGMVMLDWFRTCLGVTECSKDDMVSRLVALDLRVQRLEEECQRKT